MFAHLLASGQCMCPTCLSDLHPVNELIIRLEILCVLQDHIMESSLRVLQVIKHSFAHRFTTVTEELTKC